MGISSSNFGVLAEAAPKMKANATAGTLSGAPSCCSDRGGGSLVRICRTGRAI
jgi:hypothetical protein